MTDTQPPTLRVLSSLPRSGTHWLKHMISCVLGERSHEERLNRDDANLRHALEHEAAHRLVYDHFDFDLQASILNPDAYPGLRMVLLFRNPVDSRISQFHCLATNGTLRYKDLDAVGNFKRYLREYAHIPEVSLREQVRSRVVEWYRSGYCYPVRYEDLVADTKPQLERVLDYLCIPRTDDAVDAAIARNTFQNLSGGRDPGQSDPTSHYRRGVPGEWRNVLDDEDCELVMDQIGDYLELLGYSLRHERALAHAGAPMHCVWHD